MYIGVYRDGTGWSQAAIDYILALDRIGVDVVCRPLKLNSAKPELPERILQLEAKSSAGCTHVIQHVLPHQMDYNGRFEKNIGLFASETTNFKASSWSDKLNCMDEVWVINRQQIAACKESGVERPIQVVPHACDTERFARSYAPLEQLKHLRAEGSFSFYFIGEFTKRKNLPALIRAFHTEFDLDEPVQLVLKTEPQVRELAKEVKAGLKLRSTYKEETIVSDRLSNEGIMRLHAACDVMVMPSCGEAWSLGTFDAMALGKTPIAAPWAGIGSYLTEETGFPVSYHMVPVFGVGDSLDDLFTGNENWASIDVLDLRRKMRASFEQGSLRKDKAAKGIERAYDFSYEAVGALMKGLLDERVPDSVATTT